jgi:hypothetical protein
LRRPHRKRTCAPIGEVEHGTDIVEAHAVHGGGRYHRVKGVIRQLTVFKPSGNDRDPGTAFINLLGFVARLERHHLTAGAGQVSGGEPPLSRSREREAPDRSPAALSASKMTPG